MEGGRGRGLIQTFCVNVLVFCVVSGLSCVFEKHDSSEIESCDVCKGYFANALQIHTEKAVTITTSELDFRKVSVCIQ